MKKTRQYFLSIGNGRAFLLALLVTVFTFTSCRKPHEDVIVKDVPISMSSSMSALSSTRAGVIDELSDFETQGTFGVFGYKQKSDASNSLYVFENEAVTYSLSDSNDPTSGSWSYGDTRFWDKSAEYYYFGAYAPKLDEGTDESEELAVSYDEDEYTFTLHQSPNWQLAKYGVTTLTGEPPTWTYTEKTAGEENSGSAAPVDMMVASDHNTPAFYLTEQKDDDNIVIREAGYVNLTFSHILAQLVFNVKFKSGPNNVAFQITDLTIGADTEGNKLPAENGTTSFTYPFKVVSPSDVPEYQFEVGEPVSLYPTGEYPVEVMREKTGLDPEDDYVEYLVCSYLVVPFTVSSSIDMVVKYTSQYTGVEGIPAENHQTDPISLRVDTETLLKAIEAGKKYTVTILFDKGQVVDLLDVAISEWSDAGSVDRDVYNW